MKNIRQEAFNVSPGYIVLNWNLLTTNLIEYSHLNASFNIDPLTRSVDVITAFDWLIQTLEVDSKAVSQ